MGDADNKVGNDGLNTVSARTILLIVLGLGGVNGAATITGTADRYPASQAASDLAARDQKMDFLQRQIDLLQIQVNRIDDTHPPVELVKQVTEAHRRIREVEREVDRMTK